MDGEIIPAGRLADLASLPPKEVMIAEIVGALQSPITNLVYLLSATLQEFSGLLDARTGQMGDEPSASAPEAEAVAESSVEASAEAADEPAAEAEAPASEEPTEEPSGSSEEDSTEEEAGEEDGN
jgi:large subunit ribosomal protein L10